MANRYWVGGTGTWNTTSTTNWSATSGGAGGASVPTAADSVFFDQAGTYTVTMTGALTCLDITVSAGVVTFTPGTTPSLAISGSMSLISTTVWSGAGIITFNATTAGKTITTNGVTIIGNIVFNGLGGVWTLGSAFNTSGSITITAGTFDTSAANNYALTASNIVGTSATSSQINLNGSTVTLSAGSAFSISGSGFTFNAGTSQINCTATPGFTFDGSGKTFYNVAFTGFTLTSRTITINSANTFNNLSFNSPSGAVVLTVAFGANQTINGALTGSGAQAIQRIFYISNTLGTPRSLILANPVTISNADFRDIVAVTNSITATTSGGDCGGNTNIIFPTAKTVYWNLAGASNWSDTGWATSSGGAPAVANFPLAQDTAVFDNTGSVTGTITIDAAWNIGTIDMSARTSAMTLSTISGGQIYGSWLNGTGITLTTSTTLTLIGRGNTQQILPNGISFPQSFTLNNIGGILQILGSWTLTSGSFTLTNGTLNLNGYTLTCFSFDANNLNTRTIAFGTGNITVNGTGTIWTTGPLIGGLTVTGTPVVNVSNNTATAATVTTGTLNEANSISFNITAGTYTLTFLSGSGPSAKNVDFTGFAGTAAFGSAFIYGNLTLSSGMTLNSGSGAVTFAATSGVKTITTNGKTIDNPVSFDGVGGTWQLQDALTIGSGRNLIHNNGTLDLNGKTLTVGISYTTGAGNKNLLFNGGTLICPGSGNAFNNTNSTGFTTTAGTSTGTISMTSASAKTFVGGGSIFNCTLQNSGSGALTISGSNTFQSISNSVQPTTFTFTANTTQIIFNWNIKGTAGNLVTINSSSAGTKATLSKPNGFAISDYLSIRDIAASGGGGNWYAGANSTNVSNNTGWIFTGLTNLLISRLDTSGNLFTNVSFDEITLTGANVTSSNTTGVYGQIFDEVTLNPISAGVARKIYNNGQYQIAGILDEVTGIN
jgi:hypothetical protein